MKRLIALFMALLILIPMALLAEDGPGNRMWWWSPPKAVP